MNQFRLFLITTIAMVFVLHLSSRASAPTTSSIANWTLRLEQLDPARPLKYFELAEEIADEADNTELLDVARHLFALSGALDTQRLGQSSALALADMEQDRTAKRRLLALASLLDPFSTGSMGGVADRRMTVESLQSIGEILSLYRNGRGPQAIAILTDSDVAAVLQRHGHLLPGGYNQFLQDCRIYKADLRPKLTDGELIRMLQLEAALLAGDERRWASDLLVEGKDPLIEIDPQRIDETLNVDVSKSIYRAGQWTSPTGS